MKGELVIVGMGEVGRRFAAAASALGWRCHAVTRSDGPEGLERHPGLPTLVCVREDDLAELLTRVPHERGPNLVFVQNGFIEELVAPYAGHTRAVLWFTSKGTFFADVLQSPVFGPHADLVRSLITAAGATAESIADPDVFRRYALEKAIWSCVVGAPLHAWGVDLATARHERMAEIHAIVDEASAVVAKALGAAIAAQRVLATLDHSSTQLGWMKGGTRGLAYRTGKVVEWGERYGVPTPANRAVLDALRVGAPASAR